MRKRGVGGAHVWVGAVLLTLAVGSSIHTAAAAPSCVLRWRPVASPSPHPSSNTLVALAAVSARDVWAVGYTGNPEGRNGSRVLAERWNGRKWQVSSTASLGRRASQFSGIAAVTRGDVWAVGFVGTGRTRNQPLIAHWDGRRWSAVPGPPIEGDAQLLSIDVASADDVWAVGYSRTSEAGFEPLIEHWDGHDWKSIPSADLADDEGVLFGVVALASGEAWAVGRRHYTPLIEEWDGRSWRVLPQQERDADTALIDVAATSNTDVWAVGYIASVPLVQHWNGHVVEEFDIPRSHLPRGRVDAGLNDVAAIGPRNVWMTGFRIEHWNGRTFRAGPSNTGGSSIAAVSARNIWDVGSIYRGKSGKARTLVFHYSCK